MDGGVVACCGGGVRISFGGDGQVCCGGGSRVLYGGGTKGEPEPYILRNSSTRIDAGTGN
jgi:hypothetical protein